MRLKCRERSSGRSVIPHVQIEIWITTNRRAAGFRLWPIPAAAISKMNLACVNQSLGTSKCLSSSWTQAGSMTSTLFEWQSVEVRHREFVQSLQSRGLSVWECCKCEQDSARGKALQRRSQELELVEDLILYSIFICLTLSANYVQDNLRRFETGRTYLHPSGEKWFADSCTTPR